MLEVYPYNSYINQNYYNSAYPSAVQNAEPVDVPKNTDNSKKRLNNLKQNMNQVPFNPSFSASDLRTQLISNDEKNKYNTLLRRYRH